MLFPNRVAVVTGASSGIGWALAKVLAKEICFAVNAPAAGRVMTSAPIAVLPCSSGTASAADQPETREVCQERR